MKDERASMPRVRIAVIGSSRVGKSGKQIYHIQQNIFLLCNILDKTTIIFLHFRQYNNYCLICLI